jgi:hypothetical protein
LYTFINNNIIGYDILPFTGYDEEVAIIGNKFFDIIDNHLDPKEA